LTTDESYWTNAGWGIFMRIQAVPWNGQIVVSIYTFCMVRTPSQPAALHEFLLLRGEWVKKRVLIYVLFFSLRIFTLEYFLPKKLFSCFCFFPFFPFSLTVDRSPEMIPPYFPPLILPSPPRFATLYPFQFYHSH